MNPQLTETIRAVWKAIDETGYSKTTKQLYEKVLEDLSNDLQKASVGKYDLDGRTILESIKKGAGTRKRCLHLIESAIDNGIVDLSSNAGRGQLMPRSEEYRKLCSDYSIHQREKGDATSSIRVQSFFARKYLVFLESIGCFSTRDATPDTIFSFALSLRESFQATSISSALSLFRPFVRYLERDDLIYAAERIKAPRKRAILEVLSEDERRAVEKALYSEAVTLRDRAICLLSLHTGIRACDIVSLKIESIDWQHECISIIQSKTQNPLVLPLTARIGNALFDYLVSERPSSSDPHVFLRSRAPYCKLKNSSAIYNSIRKVFLVAGIDVKGRQCGTRMLRHSAASAMVARGIALPTIAAVLGQVSETSADTYISVDARALMQCTLPVVR